MWALPISSPCCGCFPYFETGLYLSGRGASVTAGDLDLGVEGKAKFNMLYLQVPAVVSWHFNIKSVSIQPAAGGLLRFRHPRQAQGRRRESRSVQGDFSARRGRLR
ncbi:MAG: hypothetical protein ACLRM8_08535 [Alistipes sp.]